MPTRSRPAGERNRAATAIRLLDTSAAIASIDPSHAAYPAVTRELSGFALGLAGHATFETFSVLTRLPPPSRMSPPDAAHLIRSNFPNTRYLQPKEANALLENFSDAEIGGGAAYDGLVGMCAVHHGLPLVSCDQRAMPTYAALGVDVALIAPSR